MVQIAVMQMDRQPRRQGDRQWFPGPRLSSGAFSKRFQHIKCLAARAPGSIQVDIMDMTQAESRVGFAGQRQSFENLEIHARVHQRKQNGTDLLLDGPGPQLFTEKSRPQGRPQIRRDRLCHRPHILIDHRKDSLDPPVRPSEESLRVWNRLPPGPQRLQPFFAREQRRLQEQGLLQGG